MPILCMSAGKQSRTMKRQCLMTLKGSTTIAEVEKPLANRENTP